MFVLILSLTKVKGLLVQKKSTFIYFAKKIYEIVFKTKNDLTLIMQTYAQQNQCRCLKSCSF